MSATRERTEALDERVARLEVRLQEGFTRIGEAMNKGVAPEHWETKWVELLREYEASSDEIAAHHAETAMQQVEMAGMPRREIAG